MPHIRLEHGGLSPQDLSTLDGLCEGLFTALAQHPAIPDPSSVKIRTLLSEAHRIGTTPPSFVHAELSILPGRNDAAKASLTDLILTTLRAYLPETGSLSVDLRELSPFYVKDLL